MEWLVIIYKDLQPAHDVFLSSFISDDELYGELGNDILFGGAGEDILIGDVGYAVRRYNVTSPIRKSSDTSSSFSSVNVWRKDIVLEEVGNVTSRTKISQKVDVNLLSAEDIAQASLLFVANAYDENGGKYRNVTTGEWITELLTFNLAEAFNDRLSGGEGNDVIIGQRGDDIISTDEGNDVAIGDSGTNM